MDTFFFFFCSVPPPHSPPLRFISSSINGGVTADAAVQSSAERGTTASPSIQLTDTDISQTLSRESTGAPPSLDLFGFYAPILRLGAFMTLRADMQRLLLSCLLLFVSTHTVSVHSPPPVSVFTHCCVLQKCTFTQRSSCVSVAV